MNVMYQKLTTGNKETHTHFHRSVIRKYIMMYVDTQIQACNEPVLIEK